MFKIIKSSKYSTLISFLINSFFALFFTKAFDRIKDYALSPTNLIIAIIVISFIRALLDILWLKVYLWGSIVVILFHQINVIIYGFLLILTAPMMINYFIEKFYKIKLTQNEKRVFFHYSIAIWILYPAVTLISLFTNSPVFFPLPILSELPIFWGYDFLPIGMIVVILLLFYFFPKAIVRSYGLDLKKGFLATLFSLSIIYLLFYHYPHKWIFLFAYQFGANNPSYYFVLFGGLSLFYLSFILLWGKRILQVLNFKNTRLLVLAFALTFLLNIIILFPLLHI